MVVKPAPTAPLVVIQTRVGLSPLEIPFDVPVGTAQSQNPRFLWGTVQMRQVIMIRLGIAKALYMLRQ